MRSVSVIAVSGLLTLLSACTTTQTESSIAASAKPEQALVIDRTKQDRHAFVQAACGGCHAVDPPGLSPNPQAPAFEAIVNRPGLSEDTLADWLSDAHNYPEVMDFDLEPRHIEWIAEHMLTLKREDYAPPPS